MWSKKNQCIGQSSTFKAPKRTPLLSTRTPVFNVDKWLVFVAFVCVKERFTESNWSKIMIANNQHETL